MRAVARTYQLRFNIWYYLLLVFLSPITLFILPIALPFTWRTWPRLIDEEGMTLRNGTRIPWSACTNVVTYSKSRVELVFGATTVPLFGQWHVGGKEIVAFVRERLGVQQL
jgi:hypothetical protein